MDIKTKLKTDYPDLIGTMTLVVPGRFDTFDIIQFKPLINKLFPNQDKFISEDLLAEMKKKLTDEYGDEYGNYKTSFKSFGILENIPIDKLKYYQLKVGINGPRHSDINEPLSIVKYKDLFVLENGYHRILKKIMQGDKFIQVYTLTIPQ